MPRSIRLRVEDMLRAARRVLAAIEQRGTAALPDDEDLQDIVIRQLSIIGESIAHVRPELEAKYPQVDWRGIYGLRNYLIHVYFDLKWDKIELALGLLPDLVVQLEAIIGELSDESPHS
jgi:uncharacterized protein with HEPN domain